MKMNDIRFTRQPIQRKSHWFGRGRIGFSGPHLVHPVDPVKKTVALVT
jgi:hypothetical protein